MIEFNQRKEIMVGQKVFVNIPDFYKEKYSAYLYNAIQNKVGTITEVRQNKDEDSGMYEKELMKKYLDPLRTGWKCYVKFDDETIKTKTESIEWMLPFCHLELMK